MARTSVGLRGPAFGALFAFVFLPRLLWGAVTCEEVRSANAASQAAITAFQAIVEVTSRYNPEMVPTSVTLQKCVIDYTRAGNKERHRELEGPLGMCDVVRDQGTGNGSFFLPNKGGKTVDQAIIDANAGLPTVQVWELALFHIPLFDQSLNRLLGDAQVKSIKNRSIGGRALVYMDIYSANGRRYEIDLDPAMNYLIRKLIVHRSFPNGDGRLESEVLAFQEPKPGVFFPERVIHSFFFRGKWSDTREANFTKVRVNEPVAPGIFEHSYPPGTRVVDNVRNIWYIVPRNGQPTETLPLPADSTPVQSLAAPDSPGTSTPASADQDGWPWHRIVLILSTISLVAGLGMMLWKRRNPLVAG